MPVRRRGNQQVQVPTMSQVETQVKDLLEVMNRKNLKIFKQSIAILYKMSKQVGLSPDQISIIISKLPNIKMENPERVLCLLLPNDTVLVDSVISIILWFNSLSVQDDDNVDTMIAILKWVIIIYPYIDDQIRLNELYDLIMHYISSYYLAPYICHLLAFMTRAEDTKTFRVMKILRLNRNSLFLPKEFDSLLILYWRLRADFNLDVSSVINNTVLFECPDTKMLTDIYNARMEIDNATTRSLKNFPIFAKRPIELLSKADKANLAENWYDFFNRETVECEHPMLTQLTALLFNQCHNSLSRILFWLDQAICSTTRFDSLYVDAEKNIFTWKTFPTMPFQIEMSTTSLVLTLTLIADFLDQSLPTLGEFLKSVLPLWDKTYPCKLLFEPLKQIDLLTFLHLKDILMERIRYELAPPMKSGSFLFDLFDSLGQMMNKCLYRSNTNSIVSQEKLTDISGMLNTSATHNENLAYAFNNFVDFAFMLCKETLYDTDSELIVEVAAIRLLSEIARIPLRHNIALIYLPHPNLIYKLFLTPSPMVLNCMFKLLTYHFQAFEKVKVIDPEVYYSNAIQEYVQSFNDILLTILYKLLPSPDMPIEKHKLVFKVPDCVIKHFDIKKESNSLLICNHWALRGYVALYFEMTQAVIKSKGSIYHPLSILESKTNTRHFLTFLEKHCHFTGLPNFWKLVRNDD